MHDVAEGEVSLAQSAPIKNNVHDRPYAAARGRGGPD